MRTLLLCSLFAATLVPWTTAQAPNPELAPAASAAASAGTGVHPRGDHVLATGPGYTARVDAAGFTFTPLLGQKAPQAMPLATRLCAVQRGDEVVFAPVGDAPLPAAQGQQVVCRHGDLTEVYDVRHDGIEQRFVLARRPAGAGDLVVRLELTTERPCVATDPRTGLRFEVEGLGGVTIGGVSGVDANGHAVAGTIHRDGAFVDYVLPARFVDEAAYPLVIDPLFASAFGVGNAPTGVDEAPDVAYDADQLCWLVVWRVLVSATVAEVRAQRVQFNGALLGGQILVESAAMTDVPPRVVNLRASNRFLVVCKRQVVEVVFLIDQLAGYVVDPANGAVGAGEALVGGFAGSGPTAFALGGDSRLGSFGIGDDALLLFTLPDGAGSYAVHAWRAQVGASSVATVGSPILLDLQGLPPGSLAVTRHSGSSGNWLVAWGRGFFAAPPYASFVGCSIDGFGSVCTPVTVFATGSVDSATVATRDGASFAFAWRDANTQRVWVRPVTRNGTCGSATLQVGPAIEASATPGFGSQPSLDFATDRYVLAWRHTSLLTPTHVRVKSLLPDTCVGCSSEHMVEPGGGTQNRPVVAAWWSGAVGQQDTALVVWEVGGAIRARRYEALGSGSATNLGGSCGAAGSTVGYTGLPVLGDGTFALTIASPNAPPLAAVVGLSNLSIPCGPCVLVPNTDIVMAGPGPHPIPIPCDTSWLGLQFWSQWLLLAPGGCAILPDFALSVAQRFTVGE